MELVKLGVPLVFLSRLTANVICEVYCLSISRLLAKGAIDKIPVSVPRCCANNLKNSLINFLAISSDSKHFLLFQNKSTPPGQGGPPNLFSPQILFFCDLKPHAKFQNPTITPSGRKVSVGEERERKKEKKTPLIVDT